MNGEQILYEDKTIIVCHKPVGIATQTAKIGQKDMVSEVTNYLAASRRDKTKPYVGLVHRLDQPVEGILVFAKNRHAAEALSRQIAGKQMEKCYYAVVSDRRQMTEAGTGGRGTLTDYLYQDGKTNTSSVVSKEHEDAKWAELLYEVKDRITVKKLCETSALKIPCPDNMADDIADSMDEEIALVKIKLVTGRHHQIRVQMSHAEMSLLGDYKYADERTKKLSDLLRLKQVALCACELGFNHPVTGKRMLFQKMPEGQIFQNFSLINCP